MALVVTPLDVAHATIPSVADGEVIKAANLTPTTQQLADLSEVVRQSILHLASPGSVIPGGRATTDGVKRIREVISSAALSALSMGASNNLEVAMVSSGSTNIFYTYIHGSATPADGFFVVTSLAGRWESFGAGLKGTTPGYPFTNSTGKLTGPSRIKGAVKEFTDLTTSPSSTTLTTQGTVTDSAAFVDGLAGSIFSVPNVEIGDILEINLKLLAIISTANATAKGNILLRCGPAPAGPFTDLHNVVIGNNGTNNAADLICEVSLSGRYIATNAGTHIVKCVISTNVGGATRTLTIFSPISGLCKRIEP